MPRFIAVHTTSMTEEQYKSSVKEIVTKIPEGFSWKLTYCAFDDRKFFCEWEAPSKEALEQWLKADNLAFDAVYSVKFYNVARGKME